MIPVICLVGPSRSGKTHMVERLVPELMSRGYRVATVKHSSHGFQMDREGKDSWRHRKAGAAQVVVASTREIGTIVRTDRELTLAQLRDRFIQDVDLIIAEGYKSEGFPKVEIYAQDQKESFTETGDPTLIAIVSPAPVEAHVPVFHPRDVGPLAELILANVSLPPRAPAAP